MVFLWHSHFLSLQRRLFSARRTSLFSPRSSLVATPYPLRDQSRKINRRSPFHPDRAGGRNRVCILPHYTCRLSLSYFHYVTLEPYLDFPASRRPFRDPRLYRTQEPPSHRN